MTFIPSRAAGLAALTAFVPNAGLRYAETRNFDHGPLDRSNVSLLSPYLRYRLITEAEVVEAVLSEHSAKAAEKFLQEVLWRTYWKGWLELRPVIWDRYVDEVAALHVQTGGWRVAYAQALSGSTGIDCFDAWVHELADYGYLHNHARMWFASIWIFTLRLPWQLGAELFYRQLYDGDSASNTLSWRWVAGLQTTGKTYLATAHNIVRFTEGRFVAAGLATTAKALIEPANPPQDLPAATPTPVGSVGLMLGEDDLHPESLPLGAATVTAIVSATVVNDRASAVQAFMRGAMADARARAAFHFAAPSEEVPGLTAPAIRQWAQRHKVRTIVTAHAPVGPGRTAFEKLAEELAGDGISLVQVRRAWDSAAWPEARRGFFAFREKAGALIA
ncbi:FAD-binding domain-containing protein [Sphingomonas sp. RB1R13]|uniref:FAD-binding domain-containing protein n=1 Tax=Sphingomonas sp. RB1R13 TaxID=3096159 RepID=UPI002FC7D024